MFSSQVPHCQHSGHCQPLETLPVLVWGHRAAAASCSQGKPHPLPGLITMHRLGRGTGFQPCQASWSEGEGAEHGQCLLLAPAWHLAGTGWAEQWHCSPQAGQDVTAHRDKAAQKAWELPHPTKRANPTEICAEICLLHSALPHACNNLQGTTYFRRGSLGKA